MPNADRLNRTGREGVRRPLCSSLCAIAVVAACAHAPLTPEEALQAAASPTATADVVAEAVLSELDRGHADSAKALMARLDDGSTSATALPHLARLLACERALDITCQREVATRLLTAYPQDPLAPLAAETLRKLAGNSTRVDDQLKGNLQTLLATPAALAFDLETQHLLRDALAGILVSQGDYVAAQKLRDQAGVIQSWEIVGPLSAFHYLQFDTPLGPELTPAAATYPTPWGDERWRPLKMNNGQIPLGHALERSQSAVEGQGMAPTGDLLFLRSQVTAQEGGLSVRIESTASLRIFLDGELVATRDSFRRQLPRAEWLSLSAEDGPHTLLIKAAVGDATGGLSVDVQPRSVPGALPLAHERLLRLLEKVVHPGLARSLAARMIAPLDPHGAVQLLLDSKSTLGILGLSARAELWPILGTLDEEDARGRAEADLDAWVEQDAQSPDARVRRAQLLQEVGRFPQAERDLEIAAAAGPIPEILVARARLHLAREAGALGAPLLVKALAQDPGNCAALDLQLADDDAQNALAPGDQAAAAYAHCPGGQQALAARRSRTEGAAPLVEYWRGRLTRSPSDPDAAIQLADALFAQGDSRGALAALETRLRTWPDDGGALRHRAMLQDLEAKALIPSPTWRQVLDADPANLSLRRVLALLAGEGPPLEALLPGVEEALAAPRWNGPGRAPSATLLDSGAVWLHADGTITERIRTLEVPLDETALSSLGELELPPGAALLALRTHKRDGRILDADAQVSGEKHTVSVPALQVGDTLEIDYLVSTPPPRRAGGSVADAFFFAASDSALRRSIYAMQADRPAVIDAHRIEAPRTFTGKATLERNHVIAIPEEPNSPPQNEFFPWVQVGTDSRQTDLARSVADQLLDKVAVDEGIAALVRDLEVSLRRDHARPPTDRARAEALWRLLSEKLRAEGGSLSVPASEVVGQGSGNLLLPMKAGLAALDIPARFVLVSGPAQSQEPHRFARLGEYADVLLRIDARDSPAVFLAAGLRDAPFDAIPPNLCGARALVLPDRDAEGIEVRLPECSEKANESGPNDHLTRIELTLAADGSATGSARETLYGFEATNLRGALAEVDDSQRRQGVESALAGVFQAAELTEAHFDLGKGPGAPLSVVYAFKVPEFATPQGGGLWSSPLRGFPAQLAQRYAQLAGRKLPLLISSGERPSLELTLHLPAGAKVEKTASDKGGEASIQGLPDVWLDTPFGSYVRKELRSGSTITVREKLVLLPQRVSPDRYPDFAGFADAVDRAQTERVRYDLPEGRTDSRPPLEGERRQQRAAVAQRMREQTSE